MSIDLGINSEMSKKEKYLLLLEQMEYLILSEDYYLSSLSNFTAILKQSFTNVSWVGLYFWIDGKLVLGPFQGKLACSSILLGQGVCGKVAKTKKTEIVENVHNFAGHIACDSESNSEIVVPLLKNSNFIGVLDLDSHELSAFDEIDKDYLEQISTILLNKTTIPNF
jgi:GAF domain-containing protein